MGAAAVARFSTVSEALRVTSLYKSQFKKTYPTIWEVIYTKRLSSLQVNMVRGGDIDIEVYLRPVVIVAMVSGLSIPEASF